MRFYATSSDDAAKLFHRTGIRGISPLAAHKEGSRLLSTWKRHKANSVRVLNAKGEIIYSWSE